MEIKPIDYSLTDREDMVQDIMGHTLFLLMSALQTENVTVVLDSCFSGGGIRGNLTIRSRDNGNAELQIASTEKEYQQHWLSKLNLSNEEFKRRRQVIQKVNSHEI